MFGESVCSGCYEKWHHIPDCVGEKASIEAQRKFSDEINEPSTTDRDGSLADVLVRIDEGNTTTKLVRWIQIQETFLQWPCHERLFLMRCYEPPTTL